MSRCVQQTFTYFMSECLLYLISLWWIALHGACKHLRLLGINLTKPKKLKPSYLFLETFWFDIWFVESTGTGNTHWGGGGGSPRWTLGHHRVRTDARAVRRNVSEVAWIPQCITTFPPAFLSFIDFSLPFFPHHRYHNMGNLLKVLTCTDLEQEPNFFLDFESEFPFFFIFFF